MDVTKRSELLCFIQNKCSILPRNHFVEISSNFYIWEEVKALMNTYVEKRLQKHNRSSEPEKIKLTITDLAKACLNPSNHLPVFLRLSLVAYQPLILNTLI